jgi:small subunit ribosomal protein S2
MSENQENNELIEKMFNAGAHFGYSRSRRHPSMKKAVYGVKNNMEIIDLEKSAEALTAVEKFVASLAAEGKKILFIGSKNQARDIVEKEAARIGAPNVKNRWVGGTLTNFDEIKKRILRFQELSDKKEKGELGMYTKKERLLIDRDIENLNRKFGGLVSMTEALPSALFVVDSKHEQIAVDEAKQLGIPVIALSNSDCDVKGIKYVIPGNDSACASIQFFTGRIVDAYKGAQKAKK